MKTAAKITVKGLVQGVGYRYFCYRKAIEYSLTGYVTNLFNGDVELEIEGERSLINEFINELRAGPASSNVKGVFADEKPFENKFTEFTII